MRLNYKTDEPLTVGQLRNKLKGVANDTPVYIVLDKSDDNYNEDGYLRIVHPVDSVYRELVLSEDSEEPERNLLLYLAEDFYDTYECNLKIEK